MQASKSSSSTKAGNVCGLLFFSGLISFLNLPLVRIFSLLEQKLDPELKSIAITMSQSPDNSFLALGTICVGVGHGGSTSMLARVSLVDYRGGIVLDVYVQPTMEVTDYRTSTTGIEPKHLLPDSAMPFNTVQSVVAGYIKGKCLVGHSLWQDLSVLGIPHPAVATRDVALYTPFRNALQSINQVVGLQTLVWHFMRRRIQYGKLDSVENARAALDLYRSDATNWESTITSGKWPCALPPSTYSSSASLPAIAS